VYDWALFHSVVRKHQPHAVIFSDNGPDIRWVGNEAGVGSETNWNTIDRSRYEPGTPLHHELGQGTEGAPDWVPGEVNVSIRPGWFWRASENDRVKSADELEKIWYESVGRGYNLLLNVPPDSRGLIHENDVSALRALRQRVNATFGQAVATVRGTEGAFPAQRTFNVIELGEDLREGQRVAKFRVEAKASPSDEWTVIAGGTTIGKNRLLRVADVSARAIRVVVERSRGPVKMSRFRVYRDPRGGQESKEQRDARMAWFREARFGMFIHWGLYSIPAGAWNGKVYGGASEWLIHSAQIKPADWRPLREQFNPVKFDAKRWVQIAKEAGMKYIVITSKHHEGFAMWPSKVGEWNIGKTAFQRDPLGELAEECRKAGIKLCFYYSILDWDHPDYLPRRAWDDRPAQIADYDRYVEKTLKPQLRELLTWYGDLGILWFDGEWESTWTNERGKDLEKFIRGIQPKIILNNRIGKGRAGMSGFDQGQGLGDYGTPEQEIPASGMPGVDWESCMTMNNSWGYHQYDHDWKSAQVLIQNLVDCASKGGNYLLNVGPTALGEIPEPSVDRLARMGEWLKVNGEAVYGTQAGPFPMAPAWGRVTRKGNRLYAVVFQAGAGYPLRGLKTKILSAKELATGRSVAFEATPTGIELRPAWSREVFDLPRVIVLELEGEPVVEKVPITAQPDGSLRLLAAEAKTTGGIRLEGGEKNALGFWTDQSATVRWEFVADRLGTYRVEIEYACDEGNAGAEVEFVVEGSKVSLVVPNTGGWSSFRKQEIGSLPLIHKGNTVLEVRVAKKPKWAVMNLREVRLVPTP
jgi:alpha-L-fucosidase